MVTSNLVRAVGVCACALVVLVIPSYATASWLLHSDCPAATVIYKNLKEYSWTDPYLPDGLFGQPEANLASNLLRFPNLAMGAFSAGGTPDITDVYFRGRIEARPGYGIIQLAFNEGGDFALGRGIGVSQSPIAQVSFLSGWLTILEVNDAPIAPIKAPLAMTFSPPGGQYQLPPGQDIWVSNWTGSLSVDVNALVQGAGYSGMATLVEFMFNNQLIANSDSATFAYIAKKDFEIFATAEVIPEPSTFVLLAIGGLGILGYLGRNKWRGIRNRARSATS